MESRHGGHDSPIALEAANPNNRRPAGQGGQPPATSVAGGRVWRAWRVLRVWPVFLIWVWRAWLPGWSRLGGCCFRGWVCFHVCLCRVCLFFSFLFCFLCSLRTGIPPGCSTPWSEGRLVSNTPWAEGRPRSNTPWAGGLGAKLGRIQIRTAGAGRVWPAAAAPRGPRIWPESAFSLLSIQKYPVSIEKRFVLTFACGWPRLAMTPGDFSTYLIPRFWIPLNVRIAPRSSENAIQIILIFSCF